MPSIHPSLLDIAPIPTMVCPTCRIAMRLFGIEADVIPGRDLFSFECLDCDHVAAQAARRLH